MASKPYRVRLALIVDVAAPAQDVWDALVDWESQGAWMLGTDVKAMGAREGVGAQIEAFTGLVPKRRWVGFLDTMTVTSWQPPHRCDVVHTGRVVRGTGTFEVEQIDAGSSRFHWSEDLDLPLGLLGRIGWIFVGPLMRIGVLVSLRRFARYVSRAVPR